MASFTVAGDPWLLTAEDKAKYDGQFAQLQPVAGFITGEQAKNFFLQSGLPIQTLSQIWMLSDINADGRMDRSEFAIAMYLIRRKLQGYELPVTLPLTLLQSSSSSGLPVDIVGSASRIGPAATGFPNQTVTPGFIPPVVGMQPVAQPVLSAPGIRPVTSNSAQVQSAAKFNSPTRAVASGTSAGEWAIPQQQRLKYKQIFNSHDKSHKGFLTGLEAKAILSQSNLVHATLAQIWCLSDIDVDGNLSPDEFCVAMYLIDMVKMGQQLPSVLPAGLVPPAYRRIRRPSETAAGIATVPGSTAVMAGGPVSSKPTDNFSELLGGMGFGVSQPTPTQVLDLDPKFATDATDAAAKSAMAMTFEDRRKENFEKGQAELERRRAMLREQQQKETEARMAAEKAEIEKRERIRLELEMKKQLELEKQLEKQRQIEMEREEQRRKAMEQREAARRELEHQRQLEWERQRRDQLMAEMQREHSHVDRLRLELGQYKLEFSSVTTKFEDLMSKLDQSRNSIADFTLSIDTMKITRDGKIEDVEKLQNEVEEWNRKLSLAQQERLKLSHQVHSHSPMIDDEARRLSQNCRTKRDNIERLKSELSKAEEQIVLLQSKIDSCVNELNNLNSELSVLQTDCIPVESLLENKKLAFDKQKTDVVNQSEFASTTDSVDGFSKQHNDTFASKKENLFKDPFSEIDWVEVSKSFPKNPEDMWNDSSAWGQNTSKVNNVSSNDMPTFANSGLEDNWSFNPGDSSSAASNNQWTSFNTPETTSSVFDTSDVSAVKTFSSGEIGPAKNGESLYDGYTKYVAMFDFTARNFDELTFKAGDEVWVRDDRTGIEQEWCMGKAGGKEGLFPEAFVQLVPNVNPLRSEIVETKAQDMNWITSSEAETDRATNTNQSITASADSSFNVVPPSSPSPTPGQKSQLAPDGMRVQAIYPWIAKKDNHLTFNKGDIIVVREQQDMWWSGQLHDKVGWFPKSYVKVLNETTSTPGGSSDFAFPAQNAFDESVSSPWTANFDTSLNSTTALAAGNNQTAKHSLPALPAHTVPLSAAAVSTLTTSSLSDLPQDQCVALYPYSSDEPGDLSFNQGDVITLLKTEGEWWTGTKDGQTGIFPSNFVKKMETSSKKKSRAPVAPTAITHTTSDKNLLSQIGGRLTVGKKPEIATVIAPYEASGPEQLSLQPGQLIDVRKKNPSGWWEGELQARGQKRRIGWFPANYVKLLNPGGSASTSPDQTSNASLSTQRPHSADPLSDRFSPVSFPAPTTAPAVDQVIALYAYQKCNPDELDFSKGSIINVLHKVDADWWMGELNGATGLFPSNYVTLLSALPSVHPIVSDTFAVELVYQSFQCKSTPMRV